MVFTPITWILDGAHVVTVETVNPISVTEAGSVFLSNTFFTVYILVVGTQWKDVRNIFKKMYILAPPEDQISYNQLKSDALKVRVISMAIFATNIIVVLCYFSIPYIEIYLDHKKFPNESIPLPLIWNQWYPWDARVHPYWELSIAIELVRSVGMFHLFLGFDTMLSGILIVVIGQFKLLQRRIWQVRLTAESGKQEAGYSEQVERLTAIKMERILRRCVERHRELIQ